MTSVDAVILIGYRCCGKTTVAAALAERLRWPWQDSDAVVETTYHKTIAAMFAEDGETVFRDREVAVIADLLRQKPIVLATGGGAILREETRQTLRQSGTVVWLTASPQTIFDRMNCDVRTSSLRPSLTSLPPMEEITKLLTFREPLYRETADIVIETDTLPPAVIVEHLCKRRRMSVF